MVETTFITKIRYMGQNINAQITASAEQTSANSFNNVTIEYVYDLDNQEPINIDELTSQTLNSLVHEAQMQLPYESEDYEIVREGDDYGFYK